MSAADVATAIGNAVDDELGRLSEENARLRAELGRRAARCPHGCSMCEDHEREVAATGIDPTPGKCPACEDRRPGAGREADRA